MCMFTIYRFVLNYYGGGLTCDSTSNNHGEVELNPTIYISI
eukprot:UN05878